MNMDNTFKLCNMRLLNVTMHPFACLCVCALAHAVCVCVMHLVQMETEPVVASEPMFSAAPSVQVACQVPAIPNGSSTQAKPNERSGKLTAEQLAAIEDEELLDKMVLHAQVIILDDLGLKAQSLFINTKSQQLCEGIFGKVTAQCFFFLPQLDESKDFEERKMIRAAMRDLRKRKRGNGIKKTIFFHDAFLQSSVTDTLSRYNQNDDF